MALSQEQVELLRHAIEAYAFPPNLYDFVNNRCDHQPNTTEIETRIKADLTSGDWQRVKNGLSNVLYWGWGQSPGLRDARVKRLRMKANESQLRQAAQLFQKCPPPSLLEIKRLELPEFSGISFISKVRVFLNPEKSATLDQQIMKIRGAFPETMRETFRLSENSTQIRITKESSNAYERWCEKMREISEQYFSAQFRAVDVERGFFQLIQVGKVALAAQILKDA